MLDIQGKVHRFPRLMPEVWYEVVFKDGKRAVKARALLNSGSSFVVLPSKLAQKLELKPAGRAEIELADGKVLEREVYEIEVEMKNEQTGERRSAKSLATVEERDYPLLGTEAMEKLQIMLDIAKGRVLFI